MRNFLRPALFVAAVAAISMVSSCQKEDGFSNRRNQDPSDHFNMMDHMSNTFYGPAQPLGRGVARAWVKVNRHGEPTSVGVNLSAKALEQLPTSPQEYILDFPSNKGKGFYTHVDLDWNPQGHEPLNIYGVPHFDFHFYTISSSDRQAIGFLAPPAMDVACPPQYVPSMYLQTPGIVPAMGTHWIDLLSPEIANNSSAFFTKTFIWGSYNGQFIFWEPMITLAYLQSHPDVVTPVRQPVSYQRDGWYAQDYEVSYSFNPKEYTVALLNLVHRNAE